MSHMNLMAKFNIEFCDSVRREPERQLRIARAGLLTQARDESMSFLVWRPSAKFITFPNLFPELFRKCRQTQNQHLVIDKTCKNPDKWFYSN